MLILQIIILMVMVFGGLLFALRHILTSNISNATSHLDEMNAEFIQREEEIKKQEALAQKHYDDAVVKAKDEADRIRQDADRQIQIERDKIMEGAQAQSEQIVQKAEKTREMMVDELRKEMEAKMAGRLGGIMKSIFPEGVRRELHRAWVADLVAAGMTQLAQMRVPEEIKEVRLVSAYPLTPDEKAKLVKTFKAGFGRDFAFSEEVDPSLIAGVLVSFGSLVLDGTVVHRIEKAVEEHE